MLKLKTAWRDGTTHLVMSPLEFMQRLAALVPRPRLHLIRFHGVLAPNAKMRAQVVTQEPVEPAQAAQPAACEAIGQTPLGYLQAVRLEAARALLEAGDMTVQSVAAQVGYSDASAFSRLFRQGVGLSPGSYRRRFHLPART